jgi:hypothetical protein
MLSQFFISLSLKFHYKFGNPLGGFNGIFCGEEEVGGSVLIG